MYSQKRNCVSRIVRLCATHCAILYDALYTIVHHALCDCISRIVRFCIVRLCPTRCAIVYHALCDCVPRIVRLCTTHCAICVEMNLTALCCPLQEEMYIFMEYCDEGTLEEVSRLGLQEHVIRLYSKQITTAINVLHEHGIVHRDIKGQGHRPTGVLRCHFGF